MTARADSHDSAWYLATTPDAVARWLVRVWWIAVAIDTLVAGLALLLPSADWPLGRLAPLVVANALVSAEMAHRWSKTHAAPAWLRGASLLLQVALLTALLEASGGPSNAFSVIYAVQILLAAVTLGAAWAALVSGAAALGYGLLISWHVNELVPPHHRLVDFPTHLFTMALAIATLAEVALYFAGAASRAIARREAEIGAMREHGARTERLMSLTTLAAGAAHELSTPLATIAIASKELERQLVLMASNPDAVADAHLIRTEVDRCQLILDQMSGRAGGSAAETPEPIAIDLLIRDVGARLSPDQLARLRSQIAAGLFVVAPRAGLAQVLLSLVKNGFDAMRDAGFVTLAVTSRDGMVAFTVRDEGAGMSPEMLRRAGEPFYTTKAAGEGFGLGLFLARAFADRCGGSLTLTSDRGTTAMLELPMAPARMEVA
jgi:two-component system, sensor histidine kinase RegB